MELKDSSIIPASPRCVNYFLLANRTIADVVLTAGAIHLPASQPPLLNQASHRTHEKSALALAGEWQLFGGDGAMPLPV